MENLKLILILVNFSFKPKIFIFGFLYVLAVKHDVHPFKGI